MLSVSIIICCYNSSSRIQATLEHLAAQANLENEIEIILVDNNSTDGTSELASKIWVQLNCNFALKIINEPKPGLTHAREAGISASVGDIILFCDDDNSFNPFYVQNIARTFNEDSKNEIGIIGGTGIPKFNSTKIPQWFELVKGRYAVGCPFEKAQFTTNVYGAGMAIRRMVYNKIILSGFTHQLTDRIGNSLVSGGDTEICFAAILLNYKIWWDPNNTFYHEIPENRLTHSYIKRRFEGEGITQATIIGLTYLATTNASYLIQNKWKIDVKHFFKKGASAIKHRRLFLFQLWLIERIAFWKTYSKNKSIIISSYQKSFWFEGNSTVSQ